MPHQNWIQDPNSTDTKRFHPDERSWSRDPHVFVDSGRPLSGDSPLLKTRVHLSQQTADQLWRELVRVGWRPCSPQWSSDSDI
ncbi:MAG: DUF1651 domain-containing protein [Synechococcus sp.]|uniref:DUF1651 domain-containing protein n=1 Tax=Synechococcus sp. PROS-9-1 TaxID=1968775 RepID=UPI000E06BEF4|nr:DUF1651 domain-containing protein [Synechococcus sp. PROS-9-1]MBL6888140.1 DUF1651 domain-containing protein [Synechococcus sp. BS30m-G30]RCL59815.1 MAG: DUF1651 domain-containing protein [Synechococcus sp. MED-G68]